MDSVEDLFDTPLPKRLRGAFNASVENRLDNGCCRRCEELMTPSGLLQVNSPTGFKHYDRPTAEVSAANGCGLCQFICVFAETAFNGKRVLVLTTDEPNGLGYDAVTCTLDSVDGEVVLNFIVFARHDDPAAEVVHRRPIVRDVVSEEVWESARDMIAACQVGSRHGAKLHSRCRSQPRTSLPSRIIHVGTADDQWVRLQVSQSEKRDSYLALSYCWGGDQQVKLKTSTIEDMQRSIDVNRLPCTIQDAIECTRRLGFKYLWVDALCIMQDDDADKEAEIEKMSSVYMNATVTIAASVATKAVEGFLRLKNTYEPEFKFQFPMPYGRVGTIFLTHEIKYTPEHPLDTRAWALQEFLLSPRLLIYSDYELLWQCHSVELRSVTGGKLDYLQPLEGVPFDIFSDDVELATSAYGGSNLERNYKWRIIVEQYTDRMVSHLDDRISAVHGVAKELGRLWNDQYLWGLFRNWFIGLLAWYQPERQVNRSSRAPSWSWLCLDGSIRFQEQLAHEDAVLLQENLLTLRSSRAVALKAKILLCSSITDEDRADINEHRDLLGNEGIEDTAYYLLLGHYEEKISREHIADSDNEWADVDNESEEEVQSIGIGLVVLEAVSASGNFTRIGCAEFFEMRLWDSVQPKKLILT